MTRLFTVVALVVALAACDEPAQQQPTSEASTTVATTDTANYSLGWDWLPAGYTDDVRDGWPDFTDPGARWDGTFELDCSGTTGPTVFACVEQRFWHAFQFDNTDLVATWHMLTALLEELEADRARTDDMSLAMIYFRRMQLTVLLVAEHADALGINDMIPDIKRSVELVPDVVAFESWHDILLVTMTAATGSEAFGIDIDEVMAANEAAATDDPMAFYNFIITGAGLPTDTGWPERAALLIDAKGADYEAAIESVGNTSSGADQLMRTPFSASGVAFAYGEIYARAGRPADAVAQWTRALDLDVEGAWGYREYTQQLIDDVDGVIADFDALGPEASAFSAMRVQGEAACSVCHVGTLP